MASVPQLQCNDQCEGCQALPITIAQYRELQNIYRNSANREQREIALSMIRGETNRFYCVQQQEVLYVATGEEL